MEDLVQTASEIADARGGHQDAEFEAKAFEIVEYFEQGESYEELAGQIASALRSAVEAEREKCAQFIEQTYRNSDDEALRARFVVPEAVDGYLEAWHQASDIAAAVRRRAEPR